MQALYSSEQAQVALDELREALAEADQMAEADQFDRLEAASERLSGTIVGALVVLEGHLVGERSNARRVESFIRDAEGVLIGDVAIVYLGSGWSRLRLRLPSIYEGADAVTLTSGSTEVPKQRWRELGGRIE